MKSFTGLWFLLELTILSSGILGSDASSSAQEPSTQIKTILEILKRTKRGGIFGASANANVVSLLGSTMLMFEIDDEKLEELHFKANVTFNEQDSDGKSLLFYAMDAKWSVKTIKKMVELGADLHHRDKQGRNLLVHCIFAQVNSAAIAEYLISQGVSPLQSDNKGNSLLSVAAKLMDRNLIEFLINHGIDPNAKDDGGFNLLQYLALVAAGKDHQDMEDVPALMEYLIRKGADARFVNSPSQNWSVLHVATRYGSVGMMEVLLRNGASPNAQTADGYNTLFFINPVKGLNRKASIMEKIRLLIKYGADFNLRSEMGELPTQYLDLILDGAKTAVEGMMESQEKEKEQQKEKEKPKPKANEFKEVNIDPDFMCREAFKESQDFFNAVLDAGFDVNQSDIEGQTLLFCLISMMRLYPDFETRLTSAITAVVNKGVEINHVDDGGDTCLHFAAIHGTPEMMRMLLEKGVAVNRQDIDGNTALHVVQPFKGQGKQSLLDKVEVLMEFGARTDIRNYFGKVAKDILGGELMNVGPSWADWKEMEIKQRVWNEVQEEAKAKRSHGGEL